MNFTQTMFTAARAPAAEEGRAGVNEKHVPAMRDRSCVQAGCNGYRMPDGKNGLERQSNKITTFYISIFTFIGPGPQQEVCAQRDSL